MDIPGFDLFLIPLPDSTPPLNCDTTITTIITYENKQKLVI